MSQNKQVDGIYKILPLFEAAIREKDDFALQCYHIVNIFVMSVIYMLFPSGKNVFRLPNITFSIYFIRYFINTAYLLGFQTQHLLSKT